MEQYVLYGKQYNGTDDYITGVDNGERLISIYQGIYETQSTRSDKIYQTLKFLGTVNITRRFFYKGAKFPRKIICQEGDNVVLFNYHNQDEEYTFTLLTTLFTQLGYPDHLLNDVTNIVLTSSNDKRIKTNSNNRINGENDGIVSF
jgi:hypothetical protein